MLSLLSSSKWRLSLDSLCSLAQQCSRFQAVIGAARVVQIKNIAKCAPFLSGQGTTRTIDSPIVVGSASEQVRNCKIKGRQGHGPPPFLSSVFKNIGRLDREVIGGTRDPSSNTQWTLEYIAGICGHGATQCLNREEQWSWKPCHDPKWQNPQGRHTEEDHSRLSEYTHCAPSARFMQVDKKVLSSGAVRPRGKLILIERVHMKIQKNDSMPRNSRHCIDTFPHRNKVIYSSDVERVLWTTLESINT